jgi:dTDP-glucose 4,6-dehydratase
MLNSLRCQQENDAPLKNNEKIFVTGGAGLVRLALEEIPGCRVVNFDALTYAGNLDNLDGVGGQCHRLVRGDICDRDAVNYP